MKTINSFRSRLLTITLALMASVSTFAYDFTMFQGLNPTIYVPAESLKAYIDKLYWQDFDIQAIPDSMYFDANHFVKDSIHYHILNDTIAPFEVEVTYTFGSLSNMTQKNYPELTEVNIPAFVEYKEHTYIVTRIGELAFNCAQKLQRVTMGENIKTIDRFAIMNCPQLKEVQIGENVDSILLDAFGFGKLQQLSIPKNVKYIAPLIVRKNPITSINVHPENSNYTSIDGVLFNKNENILHTFPAAYATRYTIPESVDTIGSCAFAGTSIESVIFPKNLVCIANEAFTGTNLTELILPASLQSIGMYAFDMCSNLKEVICRATTPPIMSDGESEYKYHVFMRVPVSDIPLYVPAESIEAYKNADQWKDFGQILPIKPLTAEDLFPTLTGLQRTEVKVHTTGADAPHIVSFDEYTHTLLASDTQKMYLTNDRLTFLREENNQVLLYAPSYGIKEDVVLYDWTLEVGDTLPYNKYTVLKEADFIVTDVSTITLLDGKEYKKWTLACGIEYIEGIGAINGGGYGNFFCLQHSEDPAIYIENRLICASRNGQLLYQMDDAEMERLGAECLCEVEKKWSDTWCDTWNVMEHDMGMLSDTEKTWRHYLAQDTIINEQTYTYVNYYWTLEESKVYRIALVRFTEDKKVYALIGDTEHLVYDFSVQVGDTIETIIGVGYGSMLQQLLVHQVDIDDATNRKTITLYPLCKLEEDVDCDHCDENGNYLWECCPIEWIEGVGSTEGFLMGYPPCGHVGGIGHKLLCAYKNDELQYINKLYQDDYGCEYNAIEQNAEDLFPTLWGLQRTTFYHYTECSDSYSSLTASNEIVTINDKPYLRFGKMFLREENNQVLIYSAAYDKDLVLYDWNLEVGDSISLLAMDYGVYPEYAVSVVDYRVIVDIDESGDLIMDTIPTDKVVVDKISTITLLDGKEYKTWHLATEWAGGITYVEGIGVLGDEYGGGDYFGLIQIEELPTCYYGDLLVCVSKNNKLLYQMDPVKMDELGAECLCDYNGGPRRDHAKNGKIGGRPTPTQWNMLEIETKDMGEDRPTILRAETFSYTLEDDSIVANGKTFYQLARQSTKDTATTKSFVGALHFGEGEDNRVYFLHNGVEYVLYDFTAEPGDTVEIFSGINNYPHDSVYTHVVTGKDTLENGACRMLLEVVFPEETNATATHAEKIWLAGLGSVDGIVHNAAKQTSNAHAAPSRSAGSSEAQTSVMLCAWREDSCLYTTNHPDYNELGCEYNQDPTAVEDIHTSSSSFQKLLRDGQLFIIHEGKTYNVLGVQIK